MCLSKQSKHDEFLDKLQKLTEKRKVGDPFAADTEQGPQVDQAQFDKIMSYIDKGKSEGADCVTGGNRVGDKGYFIEPTIFDNVNDDMAIATDEIFGPVLSVLTFDDKEDMIRASQQHVLRAGRRGLDTRRFACTRVRRPRSRRHRLGQLLRRL